ncbi:MAG: UDP-N-acetylmuramoyl-tripeptide--D-alanyl-D-alanine ligase [candidate division KSB1 bacterium]|nr:UDP-N-acetylmuramoyl-tripeptide--D-alanyl-D-alanine ligase [candidate division KSB1 bacterium]
MSALVLPNDTVALRVGEVVQCCDAGQGFVGPNTALRHQVRRVSIDSRTTEPGDLFIAIKGERFDGHQFVGQALAAGAIAAVVNLNALSALRQALPEAVLIGVPDTLAALGQIAHYHRGRFTVPVVALTGSVGKTTTKELTAAVLSRRFDTLKSKKSFNNTVGVALSLLELRSHHGAVVLEMGTNHFGEIAALCRIAEPEYGVILNIAEAHLEFFGDLQGVLKAKLELFEGLVGEKVGFYNADDPLLAQAPMPLRRVVAFGTAKHADIRGTFRGLDERGCPTFTLRRQHIHLKLPGRHLVTNALAAAAVGIEFGVPLAEIKAGLEEVDHVPERLEVIDLQGVRLIDDAYNSNLRSAAAALDFLRTLPLPPGGRRIAVLGDMLELGPTSAPAHRRLGELVAQNEVALLLAFGEWTRETVRVARASGVEAEHFADKQSLSQALLGWLREGDVILVKGSRGMKMEEVVEAVRKGLQPNE